VAGPAIHKDGGNGRPELPASASRRIRIAGQASISPGFIIYVTYVIYVAYVIYETLLMFAAA